MPRPLRIQYEGAFYHVISRGNAGEFLYRCDYEKEYFLKLLQKGAERYEVEVYAYCILGTHYHLLIKTIKANLSEFMHFLGSSYGSYMAAKGWIGHVFAGRYKAICIEKEEYFLTVGRYIHLNPVEAGIVKKPQDYQWSSYRIYSGGTKDSAWLKWDWLSEYFGPEAREARARYREFVEALSDKPPPYPTDEIVAQAILGSEEFVIKIKSMLSKKAKPNEATGLKYLMIEISLDDLYNMVCLYYGINGLTGPVGEKMSLQRRARKSFIYLAREFTPASNVEIAGFLTDITASGVSHQYARMKRELQENGSVMAICTEEFSKILSHVRG